MSRRPAVAVAYLAGVAGVLALAPPAAAVTAGAAPTTRHAVNDAEDAITRYDLAIDLDDDGVAHVTLDLEVDFGTSPNHGPYLTYLVKQRFDDTQDRVYRLTDVRASSDTAPAEVDVEEEGALLVVRVGDEDEEITGRHAYRVTYTAQGWVNSSTEEGTDVLYLDVLSDWQVPVEDATVVVTGPDDVVGTTCFTGPAGSDEPCDAASSDGASATFAQRSTPPGSGLTVVAAYPEGTFGGVEPILQDRWAFGRAFAVGGWAGPLALVALVGGAAVVGRRARLRGRDEQYLGLTPGLLPAPGQDAAVGARRGAPVSVQFTPPAGFRPGQLGTLVDEHADAHDVTATIIDLAVRGHLRIEDVSEPGARKADRDWELVRLVDDRDAGLAAFERLLLDELFDDRERVRLSDLRTTFAASTARIRDALYDDVTERGWFRGNPKSVRTRWALTGVLVLVLGVVATALLAIWTSFALVGLAVVLVGVLMTALTRAAPARTAQGSAVLAQADGFRRYLATAEADQLRFEEGEDLFSRYLPYAVAFGLTERWARVFADLAAQGRPTPDPVWYVGAYPHAALWSAGGLTESLASFTSVAESALTAPTPGSSGSSGTGGFSGGGVGGGGGGTW